MLYTTEPKSFVQEQLEEQASKKGYSVVVVNPIECFVVLTEGDGATFKVKDKPLDDFAVCIPRMSEVELDYKVASMKYFEKSGIKMLNTGDSMKLASNKVESQIVLNAAGIATPKAVLLNDKDPLDGAVKELGDKFPMIVKTVFGTHGVGVIKADSLSSLRSIIQQLIKTQNDFIVQEFIEHDQAYRIMVLGETVLGAVARTTAEGDFRTNAHQGSEVTEHKPSDVEISTCLAAAKAIGCTMAAVDYVLVEDKVIVLEVNGSPGFESMQEVVKENIAEKIINFVIDLSGGEAVPEEEEEVSSETVDKIEVDKQKEIEDQKPSDSENKKDTPTNDKEDDGIIEPEAEKIKADDFELVGSVDSVIVKYFNDEEPIHARIDTGAEYSAINGQDIETTDETITFTFGEFRYRFSLIKSVKIVAANGDERRPTIRLDIVINNKLIRNVEFTVNDRDGLNYEILLGRRALSQANMLVNPAFIHMNASTLETDDKNTNKNSSEEE